MPRQTPARSAGRIVAVVAGALAALVAIGAFAAGGVLLYADGQKDHDGYVSTDSHRFHTNTYALATENLDLDTGGAHAIAGDSFLGHVRIRATSNDGKPVFVGIARTKDVDAYLGGTSHATVTDVEYGPFDRFDASYRTHAGERPGPPAAQRFWAASTSGPGARSVEWKVRDGNWSVVVMNADGSRRVDTDVKAGAEAPWLSGAAWTSLGAGAVLAALAAALLVTGLRGPRAPRPEPAASVAPAAA
jgi:hypothetical protein